jgi:hypothetical protein
VSEQLLSHTRDLGEIFRRWMALSVRAPHVTAPAVAHAPPRTAMAAFLSLGVDSLYTALTRADDLEAMLFLRGFDLPGATSALLDDATERARRVAGELGAELHTFDLETRHFSDPIVSWEMFHGACLAAVAHAAGRWGRVLVPATLDYRYHAPWGSHPWTDPLWSSEKVALEDDGVWASRLDKVRFLADHDLAMQNLRVCWSTTSDLNCGRCAKCLDTILALELVGAAGRCTTLPSEVDVAAWATVRPPSGDFVRRAIRTTRVVGHIRDLLETAGDDHPVAPDLRRLLAPYDNIESAVDPLARFVADAPDER